MLVTDWENYSICYFAEKHWVSRDNLNQQAQEYQEGKFPRVWCHKTGNWCEIKEGPAQCVYFQNARNE